jgi:chromosome segregation ATPase
VERATASAAEQQREVALRAELKAAKEEVDRLRDLLDLECRQVDELAEQLAGVRREVRRARSDADRARAQARTTGEQAAQRRRQIDDQLAELTASLAETQEKLRQANERVEQSRRAEREGRSLADTRVRLLLDTVRDAAAGLRRELALPPTEIRPADLGAAAQCSGPWHRRPRVAKTRMTRICSPSCWPCRRCISSSTATT